MSKIVGIFLFFVESASPGFLRSLPLFQALKTIQERGKTKLGDKTIADSLDLIIKKLKDNYKMIRRVKTV